MHFQDEIVYLFINQIMQYTTHINSGMNKMENITQPQTENNKIREHATKNMYFVWYNFIGDINLSNYVCPKVFI